MKDDMTGAAVVLGAMQAIAQLKLPCNVIGIMACAENMPSGSAQRPGDVVKAASGKTIEVVSTDAEGRMVLADAVWYACRLGAAKGRRRMVCLPFGGCQSYRYCHADRRRYCGAWQRNSRYCWQ